jgi:uncharacterized membrane protein YidH (DUF202 family)
MLAKHSVREDKFVHTEVLAHSMETAPGKYAELVAKHIISAEFLNQLTQESSKTRTPIEDLLLAGGIPRHELLQSLATHYHLPFLEYDEGLLAEGDVLAQVDLEQLKGDLWFPLSKKAREAKVIVINPDDQALCEDIKRTLHVEELHLHVALPSDLHRIIENHQDVNPHFPPAAGRTPLAKLRTWLADHRNLLAQHRTALAKGRTGLAFVRTGVSFISIGLVLFRIFGMGYQVILEVALVALGLLMTGDGIRWYLPARKVGHECLRYPVTEHTFGTTILELKSVSERPGFARTTPIQGAEQLRGRWNRLSPIMKRRFLAIDRTDLADERTILATYRTAMARARTGLAFARTGIASIGLGIALLRQFANGPWTVLDVALIVLGLVIILEGIVWYIPGRQAGKESYRALQETPNRHPIWDFMFRPFHTQVSVDDLPPILGIKGTYAPGVWGTTGLALERTLIAERRNVKSRLRTIMARSRTGMAFIRTGTSIFSVGMGLLVYFGLASTFWTVFNVALVLIGTLFIADGYYWHLPAMRIKKQFPYCFGDMEIVLPEYGKPSPGWKKVVFSHENL